MKVESLTCNHCGAPLKVPEQVNYLCCNHCGTQLAVHREESVSYTEILQQVAGRTERLAEEVAQLAYQNELARIDREWERERESYLRTTKHGQRREPSMAGAIIGSGVAATIGFAMIAARSAVGLAVLIVAPLIFVIGYNQAADFEKAKKRYRRRRRSISVEQFRNRMLGDGQPLEAAAEWTEFRAFQELSDQSSMPSSDSSSS